MQTQFIASVMDPMKMMLDGFRSVVHVRSEYKRIVLTKQLLMLMVKNTLPHFVLYKYRCTFVHTVFYRPLVATLFT